MNATILVDDLTRPTPSDQILPAILEELQMAVFSYRMGSSSSLVNIMQIPSTVVQPIICVNIRALSRFGFQVPLDLLPRQMLCSNFT